MDPRTNAGQDGPVAKHDMLAQRMQTRAGPALTRALRDAIEALRSGDDVVELVTMLRAAADNPDPRPARQVHYQLSRSIEALARDVPATARAVIEAFADDPAFQRTLAEKVAMTGDAYAIQVVAASAPAYMGSWVRGDGAGFAAALTALDDTAQRRTALADIQRHTAGRAFDATIPSPQVVADGVGRLDDNDIEVRALAYEILNDCARSGASLDEFLPLLARSAVDQRLVRTRGGDQPRVLQSNFPVAYYAADALSVVAGKAADPARCLEPLYAALGHRHDRVRWAAGAAIGNTLALRGGDRALLEPMLAYREPEHVITALSAAASALRNPQWLRGTMAWLAGHGFEPAWPFRFSSFVDSSGVVTRDGLGWLVDGVGSADREKAVRALGRAAVNGSVVDEAVPLMLGTLLCGDWPGPVFEALAALRQAVEAGASPIGLAPWLEPFTQVGGRVNEAAAADARALLAAARSAPAPQAGAAEMRRVPFRDRSVPTWAPLAPVASSPSRSRESAALRADHELRVRIAPVWTEPDPGRRADLLADLLPLANDLVDLRVVQPALTVALFDPDVRVCRTAAEVTRARADEGSDVRLAMPALLMIADHPEAEVRATVRTIFRIADRRHDAARAVFAAHAAAV
jgi:hypothetical protein